MIHNSSVIDKQAKISDKVKIGPFCYVGPNVELADGVELISNVHIEGHTKIGKGTKIFPFARHGVDDDFRPVGTESRDVFHRVFPVFSSSAMTTSSAACSVGGTAWETFS